MKHALHIAALVTITLTACGSDKESVPGQGSGGTGPDAGGGDGGGGAAASPSPDGGGGDPGAGGSGDPGAGGSGDPGAGGVPAAGGGVTLGSGGSGTNLQRDGELGARCDTDLDCNAGFCIAPDSDAIVGGAPAGGVCAIDCSSGFQEDCDANAPGSACVQYDDDTFVCTESCLPGVPPTAQALKCHLRAEMACLPDVPGADIGTCQPACENNSDCGDRECDIGTGLCVDDARDGLPIGAECDPDDDQCAGYCAAFAGGIFMCTGGCNVAVVACLVEADDEVWDSACLFSPQNAAPGDFGLCGQLCDTSADCRHAGLNCIPFSAASGLGDFTERIGFCGGEGTPLADAGAMDSAAPDGAASPPGADAGGGG